MKTTLLFFLVFIHCAAKAQRVENIYVNLYTDSLKKGTYNYINVDGLLSTGKYCPLDSTKISFNCPQAKFSGNNLYIPADFKEEKVSIRIALKEDEKKFKEFEMYIKKSEDPPLKTESEVMNEMKSKKRRG